MVTSYSKVREQLEKERQRILAELESSAGEAKDARQNSEGSAFGKREEEAEFTLEMGKRVTLENHHRNQLREIEEALKRMNENTYGICAGCGKRIDPARLEALPQATLCLACKNLKTK